MNDQAIGWNAKGTKGAVAAGDPKAVAIGIDVLKAGGNAADAAAAVIFALNVTDHGACSIGGEVPIMVYEAACKKVRVLSGQGRAPRDPNAICWYMKHGIPKENMKMAPVPSVMDSCITLLRQVGTFSFEQVITPTLALLENHDEPWKSKLSEVFLQLVEHERSVPGDRVAKLQSVSDGFYGRNNTPIRIALQLEQDYIENGHFLRRADLAAHTTSIEQPVTIDYRGYTVCKCGPWTQGPVLCQTLRLLEDYDFTAMGHNSSQTVHTCTEAIKLAMADRDAYYGDPDFVHVPLSALLSDGYTNLRRTLIDKNAASDQFVPGDPYRLLRRKIREPVTGCSEGTTTCVTADRFGNVIAATPSANVHRTKENGSKTGITYGNRLLSFNTTKGHPNCIKAGKRPRSTLTPTLVLENGKPVLAISVAGGDLQDQITLNLLLNHIEFGMNPADAVTAPRFATDHHQNSFDPNKDRSKTRKNVRSLIVSDALDESVCEALSNKGHQLRKSEGPIASPVMLSIDQENRLFSIAGDPTAKRHAAVVTKEE